MLLLSGQYIQFTYPEDSPKNNMEDSSAEDDIRAVVEEHGFKCGGSGICSQQIFLPGNNFGKCIEAQEWAQIKNHAKSAQCTLEASAKWSTDQVSFSTIYSESYISEQPACTDDAVPPPLMPSLVIMRA